MDLIRKTFSYFLLFVMFITFYNIISYQDIAANGEIAHIYYSGDESSNIIYLTFDDGYSRDNTIGILNVLKEYDVKATFFFEGDFFYNNPDVIRRGVEEGHVFGNHTWSHKNASLLGNEEFKDELERVEKQFYSITKQELCNLYRPPMGFIDHDNIEVLIEKNYYIFYWSVSYTDYNKRYDKGADYAYEQIVSNTTNGSIILMHTILESNVLALPRIITNLKERGYEFATLNIMFAL